MSEAKAEAGEPNEVETICSRLTGEVVVLLAGDIGFSAMNLEIETERGKGRIK
jgi:hypothetical protein